MYLNLVTYDLKGPPKMTYVVFPDLEWLPRIENHTYAKHVFIYKHLSLSKQYQIHHSLGDPTKKRVDMFYCKQWVAKLLMTAFSDIIHTLFFFGNTYSGLRNNKQKHRLSFRN